MRRDRDVVAVGFTAGYSSGAVDGAVNPTKITKRQMYGSAKFDLLRKRILYPT